MTRDPNDAPYFGDSECDVLALVVGTTWITNAVMYSVQSRPETPLQLTVDIDLDIAGGRAYISTAFPRELIANSQQTLNARIDFAHLVADVLQEARAKLDKDAAARMDELDRATPTP